MLNKTSTSVIIVLAIIVSFATACRKTQKKAPAATIVNESTTPTGLPDNAVLTGKALFAVCVACHGENAQGIKSLNAPSLVNHEAWYLERQLNNFRLGIRGDDPEDVPGTQMATIAKTLVDDQSVTNVVAYIKTLPSATPEQTLEGDVQNGRDYYNMICGACHGPGATGNQALNSPAMIGVDDWYLERQFYNFKEGSRGSHPDDEFGAQMKLISTAVPNDELVTDVIAYIQSLQQKDGS